jgi:succinate dehydrogenase / fumarate reductase membrane anchor subunit
MDGLLMMLNTLFCLVVGLVGIVSVLKLVFWG